MIEPGKSWLDTGGRPIESHMGCVLAWDGTFYWYGANFDGPTIPPDALPKQKYAWFLNRGLTIYSSPDLVCWKHEATVLGDVGYEPSDPLQPLNVFVRPKVLYSYDTGRFVLLAALTSPDFDTYNDVVYATAESPAGPFTFMGTLSWSEPPPDESPWAGVWKSAGEDVPTRVRGFDMGVFEDDDGAQYLITGHEKLMIYELTHGCASVRRGTEMAGAFGESPAMFKYGGVYYLLTSRLTGWAPNDNQYFVSESVRGPWKHMGAFAMGPKAETTFDGQVTAVLRLRGETDRFIFMADRFGATSQFDVPDFRKSTHVWLPMDVDASEKKMEIKWQDEWNPD